MILFPGIIMLDTSHLIEMSRDYWIEGFHPQVRETIDELAGANWYIGLTFSHITELIRHPDDRVVNKRLDFLRVLPHVAWVRPYSGNWFPGTLADVHLREIECRFELSDATVEFRIEHLRPFIWETGTGAEIIQKDFLGWEPLRSEAQRLLHDEIYIESMTRPDIGRIRDTTIAEMRKLPVRPKAERAEFLRLFTNDLHRQLVQHGDQRMSCPDLAAKKFALDAVKRIEEVEQKSDNPTAELLLEHGINEDSLDPSMTMEELGFLTVFARRLRLLGELLQPPKSLSTEDVAMEDLPSWLIFRELMRAHARELRVKGSNMGDSEIAATGLYADLCIVDKRTLSHLSQSRRRIPALNQMLNRFKKASSYRDIVNCVSRNGSAV